MNQYTTFSTQVDAHMIFRRIYFSHIIHLYVYLKHLISGFRYITINKKQKMYVISVKCFNVNNESRFEKGGVLNMNMFSALTKKKKN